MLGPKVDLRPLSAVSEASSSRERGGCSRPNSGHRRLFRLPSQAPKGPFLRRPSRPQPLQTSVDTKISLSPLALPLDKLTLSPTTPHPPPSPHATKQFKTPREEREAEVEERKLERSRRKSLQRINSLRKDSLVTVLNWVPETRRSSHDGRVFARVARLRRLYQMTKAAFFWKRICVTEDTSSDVTEKEILFPVDLEQEENDLGRRETPGFVGRLSPEAQYALMRGYEDKIRELMEDQGIAPPSRPSTPEKIPLKEEKDTTSLTKESPQRPASVPAISTAPAPTTSAPAPGSAMSGRKRAGRLTRRCRRVQSLMDDLKSARGDHVTTPRRPATEQCSLKPLEVYRSWSYHWPKEFTFSSTDDAIDKSSLPACDGST